MEKKVASIYNQAYDEISKNWNAYMKSHAPKVDKAHKDLLEAIKSGDKDAIAEAREVYEHTVKNVTVNNKRFQDMRDETAAKITHTNEVALNYVNDNMASVYTVNYNAFGDEKISGYSFSLVNEQAVKKLATTNKTLLPKKKLDIPKDLKWNEKLINSQMLQGILQGENITKMADRLQNVTNMNEVSAIRNARTMTTAAENKGRQDSYLKATEDGVILKRIWIATDDDRTRAWHADLDGVEVDVDEPWVNEYGSIMEPGDPSADPANVYNCRCAMRVDVKGFRWNEQLEEEAEARVEIEDKAVEITPVEIVPVEEDQEVEKMIPKSLEKYDEVYEEFHDKRMKEVEDLEPFRQMDNLLNTMIDENEFRMKIPDDDAKVLKSIIEDGRFKNQFETGTTGGAYVPQIRLKASENLFGHDGDLEGSDFEKYGYLGSKDLIHDNDNLQLGFYGDGIVTFKKDQMMDRTTITVGDSLRDAADGRYIMGSRVTSPDSLVSIGRPGMVNDLLGRTKEGIDKYGIDNASMIGNKVRSYFELQYHGNLVLDDVESITISKSVLDEIAQDKNLVEKIEKSGIKCNYIYNGEVISYNFDK